MALKRRSIILLIVSGVFGMTLGGMAFLYSVQVIGASKAAPLSSSSPFWASMMSRLFLKEKVTFRTIVSTLLVAAGIYLLF
ncbi:MAG: EamA family transporter [Candidatus Bathyarchaeia archaeon]